MPTCHHCECLIPGRGEFPNFCDSACASAWKIHHTGEATPGPWSADGCVIYCGKTQIGTSHPHWNDPDVFPTQEMQANAILMASAPELLAALRAIVAIRPSHAANRDDLWLNRGEVERIANLAITKALGGAL